MQSKSLTTIVKCLTLSALILLFAGNNQVHAAAPILQSVEVYQERDGKLCNFHGGCLQADVDVNVRISGIAESDGTPVADGKSVQVRMRAKSFGCSSSNWPFRPPGSILLSDWKKIEVKNNSIEFTVPKSHVKLQCAYDIMFFIPKGIFGQTKVVASSLPASNDCGELCREDLDNNESYELCRQIKQETDQFDRCMDCLSNAGVWTAVGCVPSSPDKAIGVVVTIGLGLSGAVVLIMILVGAALLSVSQGDPNKTQEAREIITSAIIGLIFIIFSVTILQFIGSDILRIPGFG